MQLKVNSGERNTQPLLGEENVKRKWIRAEEVLDAREELTSDEIMLRGGDEKVQTARKTVRAKIRKELRYS